MAERRPGATARSSDGSSARSARKDFAAATPGPASATTTPTSPSSTATSTPSQARAGSTQGATSHYVVVPADDDVLRAWLGVSFAIQQVHAERPLDDVPESPPPDGLTIRQGGLDDLDAAARLAPIITELQIEAPVWSGLERPSDEQFRENWREALADPEATWFLAERDGEPLGGLLLWADPGEPISLDVAATLPEARGLGVGESAHRARASAGRASKATTGSRRTGGSRTCSPRASGRTRGFRPTAYRMVRYLHPRSAVILREPANALDPRVHDLWPVEGLLATLGLAAVIAIAPRSSPRSPAPRRRRGS